MHGWIVTGYGGEPRHVLPVNDLVPHRASMDCPCRPTRDEDEPALVVHHSADGREHTEDARPS